MENKLKKPISKRAYAELRGLAHSTISRQVAAGLIPVTAAGRIDVDAADRARQSNLDPDRRLAARERTAPGASAFMDAKLRHMIARCAKTEAGVAALRQELVSAADVRAAYGKMIAFVRQRAGEIGASIADSLAAASDPVICQSLVDEEVHRALRAFADYQPAPKA
jgi:hypothetical protein